MERISNIAQRLKEYREQFDLTLADVSKKCKIPMQTLSRYELEQRVPKIDTAVEIAESLGINPLWLQGYNVPMEEQLPSNAIPLDLTSQHRIPILGRIAAGLPLYAEQNVEGYTLTDLNGGAEYFALRVSGDSMNAIGINDGYLIRVLLSPPKSPQTSGKEKPRKSLKNKAFGDFSVCFCFGSKPHFVLFSVNRVVEMVVEIYPSTTYL